MPRAFSDSVQIEKDPSPLTEEQIKALVEDPKLEVVGESAAHFRECGFIPVINAMEYSSRFGSFLSAGMGLMERDYTRRLAELKGEVTVSDPAYWPSLLGWDEHHPLCLPLSLIPRYVTGLCRNLRSGAIFAAIGDTPGGTLLCFWHP